MTKFLTPECYDLSNLLRVVESLASFHAHWWNSRKLKHLIDHNLLLKTDDERVVNIFKRNLPEFRAVLRGEQYLKLMEVVDWLLVNMQKYFSSLTDGPMTIVHSDFTNRNIMMSTTEDRRVYMIDWQTVAIGNGLADLSFLLYYAVPAEIFTCVPGFENRVLRFYQTMLIKYGVSTFDLTPDDKDGISYVIKKMYLRGLYVGFMRIAGFSG